MRNTTTTVVRILDAVQNQCSTSADQVQANKIFTFYGYFSYEYENIEWSNGRNQGIE